MESKQIVIARRIQFCAGHRIMNHESKCRNVHGHNYVVLFTAEAPKLDPLGRVIDFGVLKDKLGGWVDREWDHGFIVSRKDEAVRAMLNSIDGQKYFLLDENPTAEVMAQYLLEVVGPKLLEGTGVHLISVQLWETENCYAVASL